MLGLGAAGLLIACAPTVVFPREVLETVDRTVTFQQVLNNPAKYKGRVVEFGGQIVGSIVEREEVQMLVRELPIVKKPVYGPADRGEKRGMFLIRYRGTVAEQDLQHGNMVIVIGAVMGALVSNVAGVPIIRPTVTAECFHIWRTQGRPIDDFPYGQNFTPLVQQTYCRNRENIILTTT
jgi:starvation-inducible outer membrane lipoprotein